MAEGPSPEKPPVEAVVRSEARLAALAQTGLLDSPPDPAFDRITKLARELLGADVALVSLVDRERQFFKSGVGLPEPWASLRGTPLSHSFCKHVVASNTALRVRDARHEPALQGNGAIAALGVVGYLGVPLRTADGQTVGSLCAITASPREWTDVDQRVLSYLSTVVEAEIALREQARAARAAAAHNDLLAREYHHRVKNAFAVALALINIAAREAASVDELLRSLDSRLAALADAHASLAFNADRVRLHELVDRLLSPYADRDDAPRVAGPEHLLAEAQLTPLSLVVHELATNSAKYGAFRAAGTVHVTWEIVGDRLVLTWNEDAAPPPARHEPATTTFGSTLIRTAIAQLNGTVDTSWGDRGLRVRLSFPA